MIKIPSIKPEDAKQLHPELLKWFNDLSAAIEQQLAIDGLTVDGVETFLSDDEKDELGGYKNEIEMGLRACINPDAVYPDPLPYGNFGPVFMIVQLNSFDRGILGTTSVLYSPKMRKRNWTLGWSVPQTRN